MTQQKVIGIGVLLQEPSGGYILHERDHNTTRDPGMITWYGGQIENDETALECAARELMEELELKSLPNDLQDIGIFESHNTPGTYIQMFLLKNVDSKGLILHEGKSIVHMSKEEALASNLVTNFTKQVLESVA